MASPDHASHAAILHVVRAGARHRSDDLIGARPITHHATSSGLICLRRRPVGAQCLAAHGTDGMMPSAMVRNSTPSGQLVGNWMRMRAAC
jgi:hypothetical protein